MVTALMLAGLFAGAAFAQDAQPSQDISAAPQNSIKLTRVVADIPMGTPYMSLRIGITFCARNGVVATWKDGRAAQKISPFQPSFKTELTAAGYKVVTPGEDNLFDEDSASADYEVAALITDEHIDGCVSRGGLWTKTNRATSKARGP
jgi:hypothetical protein